MNKKLQSYFELHNNNKLNKRAKKLNVSKQDIEDINSYVFMGSITNEKHDHNSLMKLVDKIIK